MEDRFKKQLEFIIEIDKMKTVLRQTLLVDKSRRENDAEHSWHFALLALILREYGAPDIQTDHVIRMALVHDLVEVYAGDTFAYDEKGNEDKEQREREASDKLFAILPPDQGMEIRRLWDEFEAMETPESKYANAMDRLQPFINNYLTEGHTWALGKVTSDKVYQRMAVVKEATPELWRFVEDVICDSLDHGYLTVRK